MINIRITYPEQKGTPEDLFYLDLDLKEEIQGAIGDVMDNYGIYEYTLDFV